MQSMTEHNQQKLVPETEAEGLEIEIEGKVLENLRCASQWNTRYKKQKILTEHEVYYQ